MLALEGERQVHELGDRIVGLPAEPREQPGAPVHRPEHVGIERGGRRLIGHAQDLGQPRPRVVQCRIRLGGRSQRMPQAAGPLVGEPEQLVLVQTDQRAFQHRRQVEVVVRQQGAAAEGHQVHHRHLLDQHHPVDAGHRHVLQLQAAHQVLDERAAPLHQDHDVAGAHRPELSPSRPAPSLHAPHGPADPGAGREQERGMEYLVFRSAKSGNRVVVPGPASMIVDRSGGGAVVYAIGGNGQDRMVWELPGRSSISIHASMAPSFRSTRSYWRRRATSTPSGCPPTASCARRSLTG